MDDFAIDVGESPFNAIVEVGEFFVVYAQKVEDGGIEIEQG